MIAEFVNLKQVGLSREQTLARLVAWHQGRGRRVLVLAGDQARAQELDALLWTYDPASFLPHALAGGPDQEREPVLVASQPLNPHGAIVRVQVQVQDAPELDLPLDMAPGLEHLILLVPPDEGPELEAYRQRYKELSQTPGVKMRHTTKLPD
ncbi:MAG: DNA polymerase III subunit chi [Pseudomonadota bacterium]